MDAASFYRMVDPKLCQGDILERVPHIFLKDQPRPLRATTLAGNKPGLQIDELLPGELPTTDSNGVSVAANCYVTRAMLLSFDCEIDNDKKHRLVALIRPLPKEWDEQNRDIVRDGKLCRFSSHLHPFAFMGGHRDAAGIFNRIGSTSYVAPTFSLPLTGRA
jgi:hypothetical protein